MNIIIKHGTGIAIITNAIGGFLVLAGCMAVVVAIDLIFGG